MSAEKAISQDISRPILGGKYQLRMSEDACDPKWDEFLARVPGGHHVQTSMWAQVKAALKWKTVRITISERDQIVAGAQLLLRSIAPFITVAYLTKGPVVNERAISIAEVIIEHAIRVSRKRHVQLLAIQPPNDAAEFASLLGMRGFQRSSLELAPTASLILDLSLTPEQILDGMKRQTRQNIRRSEREGITVREGTEADLNVFYHLHIATSQRQNFPPYPIEYFIQMWRVFEPHDYVKLLVAEYKNEPVSSLLLIPFGDVVIPKILGWSGLYPDRRPNDAVFWAAILWGKARGYKCFDLEGIDRAGAIALLSGRPLPESLQHSPDFFKLGFGGQVVVYPDAYHKLFNPVLSWLYHKAAPKIGGQDIPSRIIDHLRKH